MKNKIMKDALMLTIITLVSGLLLGLIYEITKEPIETQKALAKQESYISVFSDAAQFETDENIDLSASNALLETAGYTDETIDEILVALDSSGEVIGYAMSVTTKSGYDGDITLALGIRNDGTLNAIEVLSISETAGLGMKAAESEYMDQFANKNVDEFIYTKTTATADNEIDAISGATITTNATVNAVNAGIAFFKSIVGGN